MGSAAAHSGLGEREGHAGTRSFHLVAIKTRLSKAKSPMSTVVFRWEKDTGHLEPQRPHVLRFLQGREPGDVVAMGSHVPGPVPVLWAHTGQGQIARDCALLPHGPTGISPGREAILFLYLKCALIPACSGQRHITAAPAAPAGHPS